MERFVCKYKQSTNFDILGKVSHTNVSYCNMICAKKLDKGVKKNVSENDYIQAANN